MATTTYRKGLAPTGHRSRAHVHAIRTDGSTLCGTAASPFPSGVAFDPNHSLACGRCAKEVAA